jgi:hypothetical protein
VKLRGISAGNSGARQTRQVPVVSSRFFEKKRRKKLLLIRDYGAANSTAQFIEVFLLLFVHKKKPSSSLGYALS